MIPWEYLDGTVPRGGGELSLYRRGEEFSIRVGNRELMNSRAHRSEDALAELALARIASRAHPRVLIGGLGMGFTLGAALRRLGPEGRVVVAELVPAVVAWNRDLLTHLAGHPLQDGRVTVRELDVAQLLRSEHQAYDAILLDVDNGPAGVLAVWSAGADPVFAQRLRRVGYQVEEVWVPAGHTGKGRRHLISLAARPS